MREMKMLGDPTELLLHSGEMGHESGLTAVMRQIGKVTAMCKSRLFPDLVLHPSYAR